MNLTNLKPKHYIFISIAMFALFALTLYLMGQIPICKCGYVKLWHGVVVSSENSQHISDWYTFSHIIHGFGFYFLFWLIGRNRDWPVWKMFLAALALEMGWEIFENTDLVINRYREATISLDYYGDSIINSLADTAAMAIGFYLAYKLPVWLVIALLVLMEVFVGYSIRDNLLLNIIMLIWPNDFIRSWQSG